MAGILTPIGFLYFPALFTPRTNRDNPTQGPRFSATLLFDDLAIQSTAYQQLRTGVFNAVVEKFGQAKAQDQNFVKSLKLPFRAASEKNYAGFEDGKVFIKAWTGENNTVGVVDLQGNQIKDEKAVFGGQLARFTVSPRGYDTNGNKGVTLYLEHVQIVKFDMPRRDGRTGVEDAFKGADDAQLRALGIDPNAATNAPAGGGATAGGTTAYQVNDPLGI